MDAETTSTTVNPTLVSTIVKKYVSHNRLAAVDIPILISTVHTALSQVGNPPEPTEPIRTPAVPIRRSVTRDTLICLECGRKGKTLRRHIAARHGLSPEQYRERWGLKPDYPMSAPRYSEARSAMAKQIGLGQYGGRRKTAVVSIAETEMTERPAAETEAADKGLDAAFVASLSQTRRRRLRKSEPPNAK